MNREAIFETELDGHQGLSLDVVCSPAGFIHVEHYDVLYFESIADILRLAVGLELIQTHKLRTEVQNVDIVSVFFCNLNNNSFETGLILRTKLQYLVI